MNFPIHTDVLISGAGPAGTTCSMFLSRAGIRHVLIDKAKFPRDKVCGDALSGKVVEILKKINPDLVSEINHQTENYTGSWGVKFVAPNGKDLDIPFKTKRKTDDLAPGFISRRTDFDHFLLSKVDKEYCQVFESAELLDVEKTPSGFQLKIQKDNSEFSVSCKTLIGADGDRSVVSRKLSPLQMDPDHYCAGIRAYYKGVKDCHDSNFIELHFLKELLPGYFWIFPMSNGYTNVGAGMLSSSIRKGKINLREKMLEVIQTNPSLKARFSEATPDGKIQGWGLPLGSRKQKLSGDGFLLTGDAGSLIDPFTGEGIGNAMVSGMLAAETIVKAFKANNFNSSFLKEFDQNVYLRLGDEIKLSHTLQKLCKYQFLFNFVVNRARSSATLRDTISCMFEDLDMRSRFRDPAFYLKLLLNR